MRRKRRERRRAAGRVPDENDAAAAFPRRPKHRRQVVSDPVAERPALPSRRAPAPAMPARIDGPALPSANRELSAEPGPPRSQPEFVVRERAWHEDDAGSLLGPGPVNGDPHAVGSLEKIDLHDETILSC